MKILEKLERKFELDENQRSLIQGIEEAFSNSIREKTENLENRMNEFVKATENVELVNSLRTEIEGLKRERTPMRKSLREQIKDNMPKIQEAIKTRKSFELTFGTSKRVPVLMTMTNVMSQTLQETYADDWGWEEIRMPENFIVDIINGKLVDNVPKIISRKFLVGKEGDATFVLPSGLKPLVSFDYNIVFYEKAKIAARIEFEEELKDYNEVYNKIVEAVELEVYRAYEEFLFVWLTTSASPYVSSALDVTMTVATTGAAISAAALQIAALNFKPNVCYMNIADIETAKWQQDPNTGVFLMPPVDNLGASLKVYASNQVPQGKILVGDTSTVREQHSPLIVRFGGYTDDAKFENNQEAAIVEMWTLPFLMPQNTGAWVFDDITVIKAAIEI